MENEEWKLLEGYDYPYWISNKGRVWDDSAHHFVQLLKNCKGATFARLSINGRKYERYIHKLILHNFDVLPHDTENEKWKDVVGYEGLYLISTKGRVYGIKRGNFLRTNCRKDKYIDVHLCKDGKHHAMMVHRLVAMAFIPNPDNLPQVNHKDENKSNNDVSNLEWVTAQENLNYGTHNQRVVQTRRENGVLDRWAKQISKPILQCDLNGNVLKEYPSAVEASRALGVASSCISGCASGTNPYRHTAYGYKWKYKEDYEKEDQNA